MFYYLSTNSNVKSSSQEDWMSKIMLDYLFLRNSMLFNSQFTPSTTTLYSYKIFAILLEESFSEYSTPVSEFY